MRQFVRFSHLENGVWFARVNPNANVVPLIMGYFAARLNDQPFIIYDEAHHLAGVYDGRSWQLVAGDAVSVPPATDHDRQMQLLGLHGMKQIPDPTGLRYKGCIADQPRNLVKRFKFSP